MTDLVSGSRHHFQLLVVASLYGSCNAGQRCQFEVLIRPVLKHGPRSLTCARVIWVYTPKGAMKLNV